MRIVIDMQGAQTESRYRGIGRYTLSLAQAIVRNQGEHEILLALNGLFPDTIEPIRAAFDELLPQENIYVWNIHGPVRECEPSSGWRREIAERTREAFLMSLKPDVVHVSSLFEGYIDDAVTSIGIFSPWIPTVVTLYDLMPLFESETYFKDNLWYRQYHQRKIEHLKRANQFLAISESVAVEGRDRLSLSADAVVNISRGSNPVFRRMEISEAEKQKILARFGIAKLFILCSSSTDVRKNLTHLIRAYASLPKTLRDTHQLVMVGKISDKQVAELRKIASSAGISKDSLLFTGYVSDEELARLYNLCKIFVFPFWQEDFGLPALEAMSSGVAVIGANISSALEVIGREDALFDPYDETAISQRLAKVLDDDVFRGELAAHGIERAKNFSWDESALRAMMVFESLHYSAKSEALRSTKEYKHKDFLPKLIQAIAEVAKPNVPNSELINIAYSLSLIRVNDAPKQLFIDVSGLVEWDHRTGIQRVTRSILKELILRPPSGYVVKPVYASIDSPGYYYANEFSKQFLHGIDNIPSEQDELIEFYPKDLFLGLDLQHLTTIAQAAYLLQMRNNGVGVYFVVYDLLPVLFPHCWPPEHSVDRIHKEWLSVISQFDGAACISRAVADELVEWQRVHGPKRLRPFKVNWFHLGADVENSLPTYGFPDSASHVLEVLALRPTFMTVGTIEPRKGQGQCLAAFELLWKQGVDTNLVIIGKHGWMEELLVARLRNHPELNKRLFWLEGISDEYLKEVYMGSTCLIAASQGEGFGLPLIEAALHGLPIIARDIPVFREVAGKHAHYFSGCEPENLAQAITTWIAFDAEARAPQSKEMPWITWRESSANLVGTILRNE